MEFRRMQRSGTHETKYGDVGPDVGLRGACASANID